MILRPRQEQFAGRCVAALGEKGNTLGVAPTGSGKTVMLSKIVIDSGAATALILQHRDELVDQNRRTFHAVNGLGIPSGIVDADRKEFHKPVIFGMVQTLVRAQNLEAMRPVDLIVTDEAHHSAANSYTKIYDRALELNPRTMMLGVTATPNRGDKKTLIKRYNNVADQITLGEMIATGALVKPRTFVVDIGVREDLSKVKRTASDFDMSEVARIMDRQILNDQIVSKWKEIAGDRQTVVFCSTIDHASHVTSAFVSAGVSARSIDANVPDGERAALLAQYDRGVFQVLVNVAVLTEGWDCQPVSCIVLLRPSSYASTMIQMIGRGLRRLDPERYPGRSKNDCLVIDFGTSILNHGTLEQDIRLEPEKEAAEPKVCPSCGGAVPANARECALCGHVFVEVDPDVEAGMGILEKEPLKEFVLTEIDLFAQSPFKWESLWDGVVLVATAFEAWAMTIWYGGQWQAIGGANQQGMKLLNVGEKLLCLSVADDWMREHGDREGAAKSKRWLHLSASEKQLAALGVQPIQAMGMTRYQAACHLTWKFNQAGVRKKLVDPQARAA